MEPRVLNCPSNEHYIIATHYASNKSHYMKQTSMLLKCIGMDMQQINPYFTFSSRFSLEYYKELKRKGVTST